MARTATTFRLDSEAMAALAELSKLLGVTRNQLVNEAVRLYVARRVEAVERDLKASLAKLQECRQRDPDFEQAILSFVEAEAEEEDPVEGGPIEGSGPVRAKIDRLLDA